MDPSTAFLLALALALILLVLYSAVPLFKDLLVVHRLKALPIPGFKGHLFFNNTFQVVKIFGKVPGLTLSVYMYNAVSGMCYIYRREHSMIRFILGTRASVVLFKADAVEVILSDPKEVNKSQEYRLIQPWLGTGLVTSSYHKWKTHRKLLTPSFHFRILDKFQPIISRKSDILVKKFQDLEKKPFVYIESFIANCAMDIMAETSLGTNMNIQNHEHPYVNATQRATETIFKRFLCPWLWPDVFFRYSPTGRAFYKSLTVMSQFIRNVIQEKRAELAKEENKPNSVSEESNELESKKRRAFLEMLLLHNLQNPGSQLSDQDIEDEVQTFAFAGYDATMTTICWTMFFLGLYPEIQSKAREEIESVFLQDPKREITMEDLRSMNYLERVIKETMRLAPAITFIGRLLQEDLVIKGLKIPKGTTALVNVPLLHRDPQYFPNPEVFDPDRFLETQRHTYAYIPFSAGPRNCIAQRYAMLEVKTILANLLRNLSWKSLDQRDKVFTSPEIVSKPSKPIKVKFQCI